jgi:hypothetical protein
MLNGRASALAGCDTEDDCDGEATTRSPSWNCKKVKASAAPMTELSQRQQLRPKIDIGFDLGQRT